MDENIYITNVEMKPQKPFSRGFRFLLGLGIFCRATLSGSHKQHFIIANFSRKKAQSHLNDTVMPLFLHSFSSVPGY